MSFDSVPRLLLTACALSLLPTLGGAQSINIDFGQPPDGPPPTHGAAGRAGVWNSLLGSHNVSVSGLLDTDGHPTSVRLFQIGGLETVTADDATTTGDDELLLDDYLVTFDAVLESCVFLDNVEPGHYEVLIYAWMPNRPDVVSYTDVDQEPGNPHLTIGGAWTGMHIEGITYARHEAIVGPSGDLDLHSGIVPGQNPAAGAALNGIQIRRLDIFADGFEGGDAAAWTATAPAP